MIHHQQQQHQFQKVVITKHQSVFEPRQMQSFRVNAVATSTTTGEEQDNGDGEEHPPPLPYKKRHSKLKLKCMQKISFVVFRIFYIKEDFKVFWRV